ncbi:hypothetical protein [Sulfurimonas sp.]|uniref:hypothetical protein n=1 Tax=Sulfurimonas sp. TaxID=2022749 RepID=UPI0025F92ED5|nr:hypothetical protein [Sulfurimonas sp.]
MPFLLAGLTALASIISFIIKHPFVAKMMMFSLFTALIALAISYFKSLVSGYIINNSLLALASYFGVLDGISLYLTIVLAGFGVKQVLAFVRS